MNLNFNGAFRPSANGHVDNGVEFAGARFSSFLTEPTEQERTLAQQNQHGILQWDQVMTAGHNPFQAAGTCRLQMGHDAIDLVRQILALHPPNHILTSRSITGRLHDYFKRAEITLIAMVIQKYAYGFSYPYGEEFPTLLQRGTHYATQGTTAEQTHWAMYVQTFANYIYNWVIPAAHPASDSDAMFTCNAKAWIRNVTKGASGTRKHASGTQRAGLPLWSTKHVNGLIVNDMLSASDKDICRGHNLQLAVICNRLFHFRVHVHPCRHLKNHYVDDDEDVSLMFEQSSIPPQVFRTRDHNERH